MKKKTLAAVVALGSFVLFLPALRNQFLYWDDRDYIYENEFIRSLDANLLKHAFLGFSVSNWHPLTWLSHALDYALWGLNPVGHHLTNIILHGLNTFLVAALVMKLGDVVTRRAEADVRGLHGKERTALITAGVTALLFGIHPLHVESVAWVAERKDLLCAFFYLLAVIAYFNHVANAGEKSDQDRRPADKWYYLAIGTFVLSLLSKPMAVSLPVVLLILDWSLFDRIKSWASFRDAVTGKLPFFAVALASSIVTVLAQRGSIEQLNRVPLDIRLLVAARSLVVYLAKMIVPIDLSPFYQYPRSVSAWSWEYLGPLLLVVAITAACMVLLRKQKAWAALWSYYVVTLAPVLGIVQVGMQAMADRYTYLPSLGPFLLMGFGATLLYERVDASARGRAMLKPAAVTVMLAIVLALATLTIRQIRVWKDPVQFWEYVVVKDPASSVARNNLGNVYEFQGRVDDAIQQYQAALGLNPRYAEAHYNLGNAYSAKGMVQPAAEEYRIAAALKPALAEAHFNLGLIYLQSGRNEEAKKEFETGLAVKPDDARAREILFFIMQTQAGAR